MVFPCKMDEEPSQKMVVWAAVPARRKVSEESEREKKVRLGVVMCVYI